MALLFSAKVALYNNNRVDVHKDMPLVTAVDCVDGMEKVLLKTNPRSLAKGTVVIVRGIYKATIPGLIFVSVSTGGKYYHLTPESLTLIALS